MKQILIFSILSLLYVESFAQRKQYFETTDEKGQIL